MVALLRWKRGDLCQVGEVLGLPVAIQDINTAELDVVIVELLTACKDKDVDVVSDTNTREALAGLREDIVQTGGGCPKRMRRFQAGRRVVARILSGDELK